MGPVVGALVGNLVVNLVGPLVVPLVGRGSLSPALCVAQFKRVEGATKSLILVRPTFSESFSDSFAGRPEILTF